jgi:cytochrome c peroxidase
MFSAAAFAGNQFVRINEVMAGLNGDSAIQFVELFVPDESQKQWGPQSSELIGRVMLVFFDGAGNPTGRYVFPSDPAPGALNVLVATQEFADLTGITPDFIMPKSVMPFAGKVSFRNNPDAGAAASSINLCLAYGGSAFTGDTEGAGPANTAKLSILDSQSLRRAQNFGAASFGSSGQLNADFALGTPTPSSTRASGSAASLEHNVIGEAVLPVADTPVNQGKVLFLRETFLGNGRTCATCHIAAERFSLPPSRVAALPASDPLFLTGQNVNRLVINSLGSVNPGAASGTSQPSDFAMGGIITGLGGSATVLAGSGNTYFIVGGSSLNIPGNVISDPKGNRGSLISFTSGNLNGPTPSNTDANGLEKTTLLRGTRALILENINGFTQNGFMRGSPSLMNVKFTAPYGLSGEFADLQSFAANHVRQHFTRSLGRVPGVDFRVPTTEELDALAAFQNSLTLPANENFDESNRFDRFLTNNTQRLGRDVFLGSACNACHGGKTLSQSDGRFGTTAGVNESFDTGVMRSVINVADGLPTEQGVGQPPNTRRFNVPSLIGLKRTAPFFHENSVIGLDGVFNFYDSLFFINSPAAAQIGGIFFGPNTTAITEFLQAVGEEPFGAPTITGTGPQPDVNDNDALSPFRSTTIGDPDTPAQQLTVTVTLDSAVKGRFSSLNGFTATAGGQVTFLGTAAAATAAIRGLVFQPRAGRLPVNATEMVRFAVSANDGLITPTIDDATVVNVKAAGGAGFL